MESSFSAHNILLDDGRQTMPSQGFLMADDGWCMAATRLLQTLYPQGLTGRRIADLGCLEGGFSVAFARLGMHVVGLEVRESNFRNCQYVKQHVDLPHLQFVRDDAWNLERYGHFDVIFCCGLLYHIEHPVAFIRMLSSLCRKALILNTHFATERANPRYALGELTEHEGVQGRWFHEYDPRDVLPPGTLDAMKWSSWSNDRSFWIRREHLLGALRASGFAVVLEQFDGIVADIAHSMTQGYYAEHDRGLFVGIKS